ncbi:DUF2889 domain-containing protein [Streptomyces sp. NBC_01390]|uniref:DUF2889 domain-containing protein n=1 Tax=Streptomyces sp. NBC_01390 TaxID=2903850 RepID=UPI003247F9D2
MVQLTAGGTPPALFGVAARLPARRPSSARRTSDLQVTPHPTWDQDLLVRAAARDAVVDGHGRLTETASARLSAVLDNGSVLSRLTAPLPRSVVEAVTGHPTVSGFRAGLRALADAGLPPDSLDAALLDDLPTVRLVSGYGRIAELGEPPRPRPTPLVGVCTGWAEDATAHRLSQTGGHLLSRTPEAPGFPAMLDHPADFHLEHPSRSSSMHRRRILEVTAQEQELAIYEYFRDSHVDRDGREGSLHEYELHAVADRDSLVLSAITVTPRALPFPECPLASGNVHALLGTSLRAADSEVKARLPGTLGCTHLSDVLRFLRFVEPLGARIAGGGH